MIFQFLSRPFRAHWPICILLLFLISCPLSAAASKSPISDFSSTLLLHDSVPAESIALGTVDETPQQILLRVFVRRISDQTVVADQQVTLQQSDFCRSLVSYPHYLAPSEVFRSGEKGVSPPECEDCPAPQFRGPADGKLEKSRSTTILLGVLITEEGRVARVKVLQGAGPEFEDMAWRNLRAFRFKPARNKAGQSVAAAIQMEVFFSITVDY